MNKNIDKAAEILKNGGIIIFPTDTVFGIGCVIDNKKSIKRLFDLRKRSVDKPLLILASDMDMVLDYLKPLSSQAKNLAKKYWPGGLTIISKCYEEKIPIEVRAGGDTVGVRIPDNSQTLELIRKVGKPIVAPSANFEGKPSAKTEEDLDSKLLRQVDFLLKGECKMNKESTIVDCSNFRCKIIRKGAVAIDSL